MESNLGKKLPKDKVFVVGGYVRDSIMGLNSHDKDYVVINMTAKEMLDIGFSQVGKDFPVFLDELGQEFALARREKKIGSGYHGFDFETNNVSLIDDLKRRDITINAIAMDMNGNIIDPFNGQKDIRNKILRHVSQSFREDPLRVLRVARFASRYSDFKIASETIEEMKQIVENGEINSLTPERVWAEFVKTVQSGRLSIFLRVLHDTKALSVILPEVDKLYGVPQVAKYHPEIDCGIHTEMVCDQAQLLASKNIAIAFAALTHDLGKALTPIEQLPQHLNHEENGLKPLEEVISRLRIPNDCANLARITCRYHLNMHRLLESRTGTILSLIEKIDGFRNPARLEEFAIACMADKRGRTGFENSDYPQLDLLMDCFKASQKVSAKKWVEEGFTGLEIREKIRNERLSIINQVKNNFKRELGLKSIKF